MAIIFPLLVPDINFEIKDMTGRVKHSGAIAQLVMLILSRDTVKRIKPSASAIILVRRDTTLLVPPPSR
jgi:hypothetical protein